MCDVSVFRGANQSEEKTPGLSIEESRRVLSAMLEIAQRLGYSRRPDDRVLDFGCGIGDTVALLEADGFDAYGVDVGEWWGRDHDAYWHDSPLPPNALRDRLSVTSESSYRLPYPDAHFNLIISSQVFEHVFNYADVFRELKRVLKPGGVSVHVFPGPWTPFEPHLGIPCTALAKEDWWLRLWSAIGPFDFATVREKMKSNNYPSRRELEALAAAGGAKLSFHEDLYVEAFRGRPWKVLSSPIGWLSRRILLRLCQRCMRIS